MTHYNPIIDDPGFETDLISAASYGHTAKILEILSYPDTDINERNASGWTALMYASHYGHYQVVDELVKIGCDVNAVEPSYGRNALMMAAANGHTYCVERLVHCGRVNIYARDNNGQTAADIAKNCGHGRNTALVRALQISNDTPRPAITPWNGPANLQKPYSDDSGHVSVHPRRRLFPAASQLATYKREVKTGVIGTTAVQVPSFSLENDPNLQKDLFLIERKELTDRIAFLESVVKTFHSLTRDIIDKLEQNSKL